MARPRAKIRNHEDVEKSFQNAILAYREYITDRLHKVPDPLVRVELNEILMDMSTDVINRVTEALAASDKILNGEARQ